MQVNIIVHSQYTKNNFKAVVTIFLWFLPLVVSCQSVYCIQFSLVQFTTVLGAWKVFYFIAESIATPYTKVWRKLMVETIKRDALQRAENASEMILMKIECRAELQRENELKTYVRIKGEIKMQSWRTTVVNNA